MKAFLLALCAAVVITVGANFVLDAIGYSSEDVMSSPNVRLDAEG